MSGPLIALVGIIYSGIAVAQAQKGNVPMALVFVGYALSNVGFWFAL